MFRLLLSATALGSLMLFASCAEMNDPYRPAPHYDSYGSPYDSGYHGSYDDHDYWREREREHDREERRKIERERERIDRERKRLDDERRNEDRHRDEERRRDDDRGRRDEDRKPAPRPQPKVESCPRGYSPSERKCSSEERKKGCKDIRMDSGLGCVKR